METCTFIQSEMLKMLFISGAIAIANLIMFFKLLHFVSTLHGDSMKLKRETLLAEVIKGR
jgi:hypothetical protein